MTALSELSAKILDCSKCPMLVNNRTRIVPGEGAEDADIVFIGEGPGANEDKQGRPFVGQAGAFLDELLNLINLKREQIYITNVIKCRPPGNRDPMPTELQNCRPYLDQQLAIIRPRLIVTLGRYAMATFLPGKSISKIHGTMQIQNEFAYFVMYHPAAALYQQSLRKTIEADMQKIPAILAAMPDREEYKDAQPEPKQLNLFGNQ